MVALMFLIQICLINFSKIQNKIRKTTSILVFLPPRGILRIFVRIGRLEEALARAVALVAVLREIMNLMQSHDFPVRSWKSDIMHANPNGFGGVPFPKM